MEVFSSKIDAWILTIIVITILVSVIAAFFGLKKPGLFAKFSALILILVGAIFPIWLTLSTKYVVTENLLNVYSGPFNWSINIDSISSVQETRDSRSSPALSLDRLMINYGENRSIMISPKDKTKFRQAIGH